MANVTLNEVRVLHDVRTTEDWNSISDKVIPKGYLAIEMDESGQPKIKVGNGTDTWGNLPYITAETDLSEYATTDYVDSEIISAVSALGTIFTVKGRVDTTNDLPSEGNKAGDVYLVGAEGSDNYAEYMWTSSLWNMLGSTVEVDLSNYFTKDVLYTKTDIDALLESKADKSDTTSLADRITAIEQDYVKSTDTLILNCSI